MTQSGRTIGESEPVYIDRRRFLKSVCAGSTGITTMLAGCTFQSRKVCLIAQPITVDEAVNEIVTTLAEIQDVLHIDGLIQSERFPDVRGETRRIARQAVQESSAHSYGIHVFGDPDNQFGPFLAYVRMEGEYYGINSERSGWAERDRWLLRAEPVDSSSLDDQPVPIDEIGPPKRDYIRRAEVASDRFRHQKESDDVFHFVDGVPAPKLAATDKLLHPYQPAFVHTFRESDADPEEIKIAPDPEPRFIEFGEHVERLAVDRRTVKEPRYTYTASRLKDATAVVEGVALDEGDDRRALTSGEQELFERVIASDTEVEIFDDDEDYDAASGIERSFHVGTGEFSYVWYDDELYRVYVEELWENEECPPNQDETDD